MDFNLPANFVYPPALNQIALQPQQLAKKARLVGAVGSAYPFDAMLSDYTASSRSTNQGTRLEEISRNTFFFKLFEMVALSTHASSSRVAR